MGTSRTSQPGDACLQDASKGDITEAREPRPECVGCSARRRGQLHTLHRDDRGGEECRKSVRWERKGPGSAVDRLLDIFHFKITHLLVKIKFRYFCYDTIVLMYYLDPFVLSVCPEIK